MTLEEMRATLFMVGWQRFNDSLPNDEYTPMNLPHSAWWLEFRYPKTQGALVPALCTFGEEPTTFDTHEQMAEACVQLAIDRGKK